VTISWSHGYAREEILGKMFSVKKGTEVGGQRISLGPETGWYDLPKHKKHEKVYGIKTNCREKKPAHVLKN